MLAFKLKTTTEHNQMARNLRERAIQGIFLSCLLVGLPTISLADPNTIPADVNQVNSWFSNIIKPFSERKGTLDPALVNAENSQKIIRVRKDGSGDFKTVTEAVKSVPAGNTQRIIISIGPGVYWEKITIERTKPFITLYGDPKDMPTLKFDGTAAQYGTVYSGTLSVYSNYFVAANLIIANTAPRPDGKRLGAQALALRILGENAALYNCRLLGFQDTFNDDTGKHFFKDCYIEGTVDFIFGDGRSLYLNSELHVIPGDRVAMITAQGRQTQNDNGGYSFVHCKVTGTGQIAFLGRAWMPAPRVIFSYTTMSDVVRPEGWSDNFKPQVQQTVFYGEYQSMGPGAQASSRVKYAKALTYGQVQEYISLDFIEAAKWLLPPPRV